MIRIANAQLWVHDQDEALAFYTEKLGFSVQSDVTVPEMGDFRWLTVSPAGQPDVAIVLMAIPGAPVFDDETAEQVRDADGQGRRERDLPHHGRLPRLLRGAQEPRRGVHRRARGAPLRHRLRVPRPVGQPPAAHAGARGHRRV